MTLKYSRFAIKPQICDVCKRIFVLEPYDIYTQVNRSELGVETKKELLKCKRCDFPKE